MDHSSFYNVVVILLSVIISLFVVVVLIIAAGENSAVCRASGRKLMERAGSLPAAA